jgi:hypothetical protein
LDGGAPSCQNGNCSACAVGCSYLCATCILIPGGASE